MEQKDQKDLTADFMYGEWSYKDDQNSIHILISNLHRRITLTHNDKIIEFSDYAHWFGNQLWFMPNLYYIVSADENRLIFGKYKDGSQGEIEWQYSFSRIK